VELRVGGFGALQLRVDTRNNVALPGQLALRPHPILLLRSVHLSQRVHLGLVALDELPACARILSSSRFCGSEALLRRRKVGMERGERLAEYSSVFNKFK